MRISIAACFAAALFSGPPSLLGCVLWANEFTVAPSFVVVARNGKEPVPDIEVEILRGKALKSAEVVIRGKTGPNGTFRVQDLSPGDYILRLGEGSAFVDSAFLQVKAMGSRGARKEVRMAWPPGGVLRMVRFRGVLHEHVFNEGKARYESGSAISGARIEVRDARSQSLVTRTATRADGSFDLGELRSGIYVVQFDEGDLALHVVERKGNFSNGVKLGISFTTCGLFYTVSPLPKAKKEARR